MGGGRSERSPQLSRCHGRRCCRPLVWPMLAGSIPLGLLTGAVVYYICRMASQAWRHRRMTRHRHRRRIAFNPGRFLHASAEHASPICAWASTSTTWPPSATRAADAIPIPCAPRSWRWRPAPTASPRTCARTAATSPTPTSARLKARADRPLNLEMAATEEMVGIALRHGRTPSASCPSGARSAPPRAASTSSARRQPPRAASCASCKAAGIRVSLFIEPDAGSDRGRGRDRRRSGRTAHRRLLRAGARGRCARRRRASWTGSRARRAWPPARAWRSMPATASTTTRSQPIAAHPGDRRAQHRPLPDRRGDLRRPGRRRPPHARADGRGPQGRARAREVSVIIGLGNDLIDIRRIEKTLERFGERFLDRIFTEIERREVGPPRSAAPPPTPSASPPRRPAPRRWAPACSQGVFWRDMGVVNLPSGQPDHGADRGRSRAARGDHPGRLRGPHRPDPDRRFPAGPGHCDHLGPCRRSGDPR